MSGIPSGGVPDDEGAVAVHRGVEREAARRQEGLAATRAVADRGDAAVRGLVGLEMADAALDVADESLVGHSSERPDDGGGVVRGGTGRLPAVEVRADRQITVRRELARDLLHPFVVAGHVVDHHDPATAVLTERLGEISLDLVAAVAREADRLCSQRLLHVLIDLPFILFVSTHPVEAIHLQ